jgi:hypothetical protein
MPVRGLAEHLVVDADEVRGRHAGEAGEVGEGDSPPIECSM